jgi:cytochrome b561
MTTTKIPATRFSTPSIAMHWLMVLVFIGIYAVINLKGFFPKGTEPRELMKALHFSLGLLAFGLVGLRIVFRVRGSNPAIVPTPPAWQEKLAMLGHLALYVLMVAMPLLGWAALSASGKPVAFFGWVLPSLLAENLDLGHNLKEIHETVGTLGYFLIGGHTLAALYHHYFMKDSTLRSMSLKPF